MKKALKAGCLGLLVLGVLAVAGLLFLAWRSKPLPTTDEALATLPEVERKALEQLCGLAKVEPRELRNIGAYEGELFDRDVNRLAVVIHEGRVIGLCVRGKPFTAVPEVRALTALEALDLRNGGLTQWPDLSALGALKQLDFSDQPLSEPDAKVLPPKLVSLRLANTRVTDMTSLGGLDSLRELDVSGTPVASIEPLLGMELESLNLSGTMIAKLPDVVPDKGDWALNLDGTPLLNPPGYAAKWPFEGWIVSTTRHADMVEGVISKDKVEVMGTAEDTNKTRMIYMPRCIDPGVRAVMLEVTCTGGKARVWLEEPAKYFDSPWIDGGKVRGFGILRGRGYVSQELSAEKPVKLRGYLRLTTVDRIYEMPPGARNESMKPPDWCDYAFYLEPREGSTVSGVRFKVVDVK